MSLPAYVSDATRLTEFVAKRALRRLDKFSKLAALGACLALEDAGLRAAFTRAILAAYEKAKKLGG